VRRPSSYVPLSVNVATGRTGTALLERYGLSGLGAWVALIATAGIGNTGRVMFRHEEDWGAIGLGAVEVPFTLREFLRFLGQRKQTRTTRQGRVMYVELTQWERWNKIRRTEVARQQKARKRRELEPDIEPDNSRTQSGHMPDPEAEAETEKFKGNALSRSEGTGEGLPVNNELGIARLLAFVGEQGSSEQQAATEGTIRGLSRRLPEGALAKVLESAESKNGEIQNRAAYVVGSLKKELVERDQMAASA
jgi:hypothetical protein